MAMLSKHFNHSQSNILVRRMGSAYNSKCNPNLTYIYDTVHVFRMGVYISVVSDLPEQPIPND